jgi:hypothetical protein
VFEQNTSDLRIFFSTNQFFAGTIMSDQNNTPPPPDVELQFDRCSLCLRNNEDHNHLFFECSYTKAIWWDVCDRCDIPRMTKAGMNGFDGPLSLGMARVSSIFLVN